jgi:hypothetical protein
MFVCLFIVNFHLGQGLVAYSYIPSSIPHKLKTSYPCDGETSWCGIGVVFDFVNSQIGVATIGQIVPHMVTT